MFTTLAGAGGPGAVDGPGSRARFNSPQGIALDLQGNLYVADTLNETIRKVAPDSSVATVAGLALKIGVDNGAGASARFNSPAALAVDANHNVYVADQYNHTIRKITPGGLVTTLAGSPGQTGHDDGLGNAARFNFPSALAIDPAGNLYVADTLNHAIRKITPAGQVTTPAGNPAANGTDDGIGNQARFNSPRGIAYAPGGLLYVADTDNQTLRRITADGTVTTLAGTAGQPGNADGTGASASFSSPYAVAAGPDGTLYVADSANDTIRRVTPDGTVTSLAGDPTPPDLSSRPFISFADGLGQAAQFKYPQGIAIDALGNAYVADSGNNAIRRITPAGQVTTLAGSIPPGSQDGPASSARFRHPTGLAPTPSGNLFVVDGDNFTIRQIATNGLVQTIAGLAGASGINDGPGADARFTGPRKLTLSPSGNLFVADTANATIRQLTPSPNGAWIVSTFAGQARNPGSANGAGTAAQFNALYDVAADSHGNLFVADKDNQVIRKITPDGAVSTFAGIVAFPGSTDGPGDQAQFKSPYGIAVDSGGYVYVADTLNHTIRKITPDGMVSTLAGQAGSTGNDDGPGSQARFTAPYGVAVDAGGNVYVADYFNNLIRKITPQGFVSTVAGQVENDPDDFPLNGSADGAGSAARFYNPKGIAVDPAGTIYVADSFNNAVRVGTTNACRDLATIDAAIGRPGELRQLDTNPRTALAWDWSIVRRPANSHATLSASNVRNPTFTPDVLDTYIFQLRATNAAGAICVRTVSLTATPPPPAILGTSLLATNGQFGFSFQGPAGATVQVETSSTLTNWTPLGIFTNQDGIFSIIDNGPNPLRGFYRLKQF